MTEPNTFIVGAGKCGTTALWHWLREHPRIFMSALKEPRFFADDMPDLLGRVSSRADYLALFVGAEPRHVVVGEASVHYLFSRTAPANIRAFDPHARIVVALRNPVDMAHASHSEYLYWCLEEEPDFETAWRLHAERSLRGAAPPVVWSKAGPWPEMCRLGDQVERLLAVFPREQVHFVVYDDLVADPRSVYEGVLAFLHVPSDGRTLFPRRNANKVLRSRLFARLIGQHARVGAISGKHVGRGSRSPDVWGRLIRLNTSIAPRPAMRDEFRLELVEHFREDVDRLADLVGRDLEHWHR